MSRYPQISYKDFDIKRTFISSAADIAGSGKYVDKEAEIFREIEKLITAMEEGNCFDDGKNKGHKEGLLHRIEVDVKNIKTKKDFDNLLKRLEKALGFKIKGEKLILNEGGNLSKAKKGVIEKAAEYKFNPVSKEKLEKHFDNLIFEVINKSTKKVEERTNEITSENKKNKINRGVSKFNNIKY